MNESENKVDKCCFCGTIWGALVKLHQGWCCIDCLQMLLDSRPKKEKKKE